MNQQGWFKPVMNDLTVNMFSQQNWNGSSSNIGIWIPKKRVRSGMAPKIFEQTKRRNVLIIQPYISTKNIISMSCPKTRPKLLFQDRPTIKHLGKRKVYRFEQPKLVSLKDSFVSKLSYTTPTQHHIKTDLYDQIIVEHWRVFS